MCATWAAFHKKRTHNLEMPFKKEIGTTKNRLGDNSSRNSCIPIYSIATLNTRKQAQC